VDEALDHLDGRLEGTTADVIRGHLDTCGTCAVVMAEAARASTLGPLAGVAPRTLADGERVAGRYEIRRFIARGGMGEVYEAFDAELGEPVALKTLVGTAVD